MTKIIFSFQMHCAALMDIVEHLIEESPLSAPPPLFFTLHDPYSEILPQLTHFTTRP